MAERWVIIEVTVKLDDEIDDIDGIMERIHDTVETAVCPHPDTWMGTSEDILRPDFGDECRDFVLGSRIEVSGPVTRDEEECPFCGHKDE